jgi:hypothetical protein
MTYSLVVFIIVIPDTSFNKNAQTFSEVFAYKLCSASPGNNSKKIRLSFLALPLRAIHCEPETAYRDVAACGVPEFRVCCQTTH